MVPVDSTQSAARRVRALDLLLICCSAPVWLPALALTGLAVLATSGRPVFFLQKRVGRDRAVFNLIKFRTMRPGDNPVIPVDERITPIGRFLRRSSLDELPQLFNVIRGEMSLVGPRPMLPKHARFVGPEREIRFAVRPGLTGLAQVSGRNAIAWSDRLACDATWVEGIGVRSALKILQRTARVVISGEGVDGHCANDPFLREDPPAVPERTIELDSLADAHHEAQAVSS